MKLIIFYVRTTKNSELIRHVTDSTFSSTTMKHSSQLIWDRWTTQFTIKSQRHHEINNIAIFVDIGMSRVVTIRTLFNLCTSWSQNLLHDDPSALNSNFRRLHRHPYQIISSSSSTWSHKFSSVMVRQCICSRSPSETHYYGSWYFVWLLLIG